MKYDYIASVELNSNLTLSETADKLTNIFCTFVFEEDEYDRFDEVPAYIAVVDDIELILLGPPDDVDADYFLLKLYSKKEIELGGYSHFDCEFLKSLPISNAKIEESGYVNVSEKLVNFVNQKSNEIKCILMD